MAKAGRGQTRRDSKRRVLRPGESIRADGKYQYKYHIDGKPHFVYSWKLEPTDKLPKGKKPCLSLRELEKQVNTDLDLLVNIVDGQMTVCELVDRYLKTKTGVRQSTKQGYVTVQRLLAKEAFGKKTIRSVKTSDAKLFLIKLQQEDGKSYSSIHTIRGVLRPAFQMAVDDDILVKNPFGFQLAGVLVNDAVTREAITKDQMRKFLKFVHDDVVYCKYYEVVYILFHTGMRISEFCGLTLKDIDLENRKGTVLLEVGSMLAKGSPMTDENGKIVRDKEGKVIYEPYKIKVLNTINFKKSMHYNPFVYIRSEKDILKLVTTIIANTKGEGQQSGEDFWVKAEKLYYCALIGYIWYEGREEEKNFNTLLEMINASEAREDDENFKNPVDLMFDELEQKDPNHFAVRQYKKYKLAAGKTAKSILISCGARLTPFDIAELRELMSYDELELDLVGDRKTALFVIISDTDDTFNFIVSIMYTQLFNLLCDRADDVYGGRLPIHVRCLLDEFANIGQIPKFEKLIATIRSREISASIILQSKSQLKAIYKDNADTIEGNCDTTLFLGGKEKTTLKEIAEILGKETIDLYNTSDTRGSQRSYGMNYQKTGKELMSQDEIAVMDGGKCILQVRGVRPFFSNKYDICKHKNYKYLSDYDKKNTFDIEKYLSTNLILKPEDEVELYQM